MVSSQTFMPKLLLITFSFATMHVWASPQEKLKDANELYKQGEYSKSAELYQALIDDAYVSYRLYYNLGNAFYKQGKYGKAILNYHRAKRIKPNENDVLFNLKMAESQIRDKVVEVPIPWFKRVVEQFILSFSISIWAWMAIVFVILALVFWVLLISNRISFVASLSGMLIGLTLSFVSLAGSIGRSQIDDRMEGVVLVSQIPVKSAPSDQGEDMFLIHEGVFLFVLEEYQDWVKIKLKNNNVGWIPKKAFEAI